MSDGTDASGDEADDGGGDGADAGSGGADGGGTAPANTMRERVGDRRDRFRLYLLLNVNRLLLTAAMALGMFAVLVALGAYSVPPFRAYMYDMGPSRYLFQAMVTALVTGVTLVVTIGQLVFSQEIGALGDQRSRMRESIGFRADVENVLDSSSPPEPERFLVALLEQSRVRSDQLGEAFADHDDDDLREDVEQFAEGNRDQVNDITSQLENSDFGEYAVVKSALDYNYAWKISRMRTLRGENEDALDRDQRRAIDGVIEVLSLFGPAREHIKTLYFQWQFADLSRQILYVSIPALALSAAAALYLAPASYPGSILGIDNLIWIASGITTVASLPFLLLASHILRIATVAKRTLAIGPFILRESERSDGG